MAEQMNPVCDFGWQAVDFSLPGVDGNTYRLADHVGESATLVMFICNHCPYVRTAIDRIVEDVDFLRDHGVKALAIMSNDVETYPDDSFENMGRFAADHRFGFPYLIDESQDVARAYAAICTPDFFGFNADLGLQYRGRLDAAGREPCPPGTKRELREAMLMIAQTGQGPREQISSIGCSIKWRQTNH